MDSRKKNDRVTIANIVSIIGIVLLLIVSCVGNLYISGGEPGMVVASLGITIFIALLLWLLIKAKGATNSLKQWRFVEGATLAVYVLMFFVSLFLGGVMQFFVVWGDKEEIQGKANADLQKIEDLMGTYRTQQDEYLDITETGLRLSVSRDYSSDPALEAFKQRKTIYNEGSVENFIEIQRDCIDDAYDECQGLYLEVSGEIKDHIDNWSVIFIASDAQKVDQLTNEIGEGLTVASNEVELPAIDVDTVTHTCSLGAPLQRAEYSIDADDLQFSKALLVRGFSPIAIIAAIIIHFLVLFSYIFAYRSKLLDIKDNEQDTNGMTLY